MLDTKANARFHGAQGFAESLSDFEMREASEERKFNCQALRCRKRKS